MGIRASLKKALSACALSRLDAVSGPDDGPEALLPAAGKQQQEELATADICMELSPKARGKLPLSGRPSDAPTASPMCTEAAKTVTTSVLKFRRADAETPFGMTVSSSNRVTEVGAGSLAEAAGARLFDRIIAVDQVTLGENRVGQALQGKLQPKLTIERSPASAFAAIADIETPEGAEEWINAVIACARGDYNLLGSCVQARARAALASSRYTP